MVEDMLKKCPQCPDNKLEFIREEDGENVYACVSCRTPLKGNWIDMDSFEVVDG